MSTTRCTERIPLDPSLRVQSVSCEQYERNVQSALELCARGTLSEPHTVVVGGTGFVGIHLADALLSRKRKVHIFDNIRDRSQNENVKWLISRHGFEFDLTNGLPQQTALLESALKNAECVFHIADHGSMPQRFTQTLVDFEQNASPTLHLLHCLEEQSSPPPLVYLNTAKVYGSLESMPLQEIETRYVPFEHRLRRHGLDEQCSLTFDTAGSCSTGMAERYVLQFAACSGHRAVILRAGTIYGPGHVRHGANWVVNFMADTADEKSVSIYGDGKQVRDLLYIDDAVRALLLAENHLPLLQGQAYNIGGGAQNSLSLLEYLHYLRDKGLDPQAIFRPWLSGDQRYYVSDCRKFSRLTGWKPFVDVEQGLNRLHESLLERRAPDSTLPQQ